MPFFIFILLLAPFACEAKMFSYFSPPKNWEIATPDKMSRHVKLGFIGPTKQGFSASLNLATENVGEISLTEYIKAVQAIYERTTHNQWRHLGKIKTQAGESVLIEIDTKTESGDVRLMQMIYLKDKVAYIITAAALKEEFGTFIRDFQKAFQSFNITEDLFLPVGAKREEFLRKAFENAKKMIAESADKKAQKKQLIPFQKTLANDFSDMGSFWQFLLLEELLK